VVLSIDDGKGCSTAMTDISISPFRRYVRSKQFIRYVFHFRKLVAFRFQNIHSILARHKKKNLLNENNFPDKESGEQFDDD
jgi:hypothetical protein